MAQILANRQPLIDSKIFLLSELSTIAITY